MHVRVMVTVQKDDGDDGSQGQAHSPRVHGSSNPKSPVSRRSRRGFVLFGLELWKI